MKKGNKKDKGCGSPKVGGTRNYLPENGWSMWSLMVQNDRARHTTRRERHQGFISLENEESARRGPHNIKPRLRIQQRGKWEILAVESECGFRTTGDPLGGLFYGHTDSMTLARRQTDRTSLKWRVDDNHEDDELRESDDETSGRDVWCVRFLFHSFISLIRTRACKYTFRVATHSLGSKIF